jgi:hypothetical protein
MIDATSLDAFVEALKTRLRPLEGPYFATLRDGSMSREDFVETQVQFAHAVFFFSRPMMVLAARVSNPKVRLPLLQNVGDEHGDGDLSMSHEATFTKFLERLGVPSDAPWQRPLWPEVRAFNTVLAGVCTLDDVPTALATLGIIEDLFAGISAEIGRSVVARGFLSADALAMVAALAEVNPTRPTPSEDADLWSGSFSLSSATLSLSGGTVLQRDGVVDAQASHLGLGDRHLQDVMSHGLVSIQKP